MVTEENEEINEIQIKITIENAMRMKRSMGMRGSDINSDLYKERMKWTKE
jgi:hypothetical protein